MAETTAIEWAHATWSPVWGCTQISPACDNCYAKALGHRFGTEWGPDAPRREFGEQHWREPLRWNRKAGVNREQWRVFPSMCDPFDKDWPDGVRDRFWKLIEDTPNLTWLLLSKRVGNVAKMVPPAWLDAWPMNVWLGSTVVNQEEFDRDVPKLLALPAHIRFLSCEPLLGPIDLSRVKDLMNDLWYSPLTGEALFGWRAGFPPPLAREHLSWAIVGGESGSKARPLRLDWVRSIVAQLKAAKVPVLVKQLGSTVLDSGMSSPGQHWPVGTVRESFPRCASDDPAFAMRLRHSKGGDWEEWPEDLRVREFPA